MRSQKKLKFDWVLDMQHKKQVTPQKFALELVWLVLHNLHYGV